MPTDDWRATTDATDARDVTTTARPLPYDDPRHLGAHQFLVEEAHLLDNRRFADWLELLCDDIVYRMPATVTTAIGGERPAHAIDHFDENVHSLRKRVERFATPYAWAEDPPSRLRHFVTNVRTFPGAHETELAVESYVLLFRSRGDDRPSDLLSAARDDILRAGDDGRYRLAQRIINVDEAVLHTQNLALFL